MGNTSRRQFFPLLAATPALSSLWAGDWPQFLGPNRNAVTAAAELPTQWQVAWQRPIGAGFAAPSVAEGKLLVFHRQKNEEICEALDPASGKPLWRFAQTTFYRDDFGFDEGPRAAPAVVNGRVFLHGAEGTVSAVALATGKRLWSVDTSQAFPFEKQFFGQACPPLVVGEKLLLQVGGKNSAGIVALHAATGKTAWTATSDEAGYAGPVPRSATETLCFTRSGLVALHPETGKVRLQFRWRSRSNTSVNAATPIVQGNQVFLTASYGTGAVLLDISGPQAKVLWSNDDSLSSHYATPVLHQGHLYGYHGRQEMGAALRCVEWATGKVKWEQEGFGAGSILLAGETLLAMREGGELLLAKASPEKFQPLSRKALLPPVVRAYPALANGYLFVRNANTLLAVR